jgi:Oxidoreductase molybdopterin binding domain
MVEIVVNGADGPVLDGTPDFVKSIPVDKALDDNTLIAYEMNGAPIPRLNGFPIRLIVPGWTATYWMKHLDNIQASTKPFAGFWMKSAYRIPTGKFPIVQHFLSQTTATSEPISEMVVNSMITAPQEGHAMRAAETADILGLAWTADMASGAWKSPLTAAKPGTKPSLVRTSAALPFAPFAFLSRRRVPANMRWWREPATVSVRPRPRSSFSIRRATTITLSAL